jgi:hypothetical protein
MHIPILSAALVGTLLASRTATAKTLGKTSFGIDPLVIQSGGGHPNVTNVLYDPPNANTGAGYLSVAFPAPASANQPQYLTFVQAVMLKPETKYTAKVFAKSPNATGNCYVSIGFHANSGSLLNVTEGVVVGQKYEKFAIKVDSGNSTGSSGAAYFYISCLNGTAETVFVDDYELVQD